MSTHGITFWKMHGAANDFILVDDRGLTFPCDDHDWIASIAKRNTGIGSEGVILIQPSDSTDFRMRFYNPDGNEVEMCGNGARCVARLAHEIGAAPARMSFDTVAGVISADVLDHNQIRLEMTAPKNWELDLEIDIDESTLPLHAVNTGVPHAVIQTGDIDSVDLLTLGPLVRFHQHFAPDGTNVNFIQKTGAQSLAVRTYERGVEAETPACGTGIVASALIAAKKQLVSAPVTIRSRGGHDLQVDLQLTDSGAENVTLTGPAEYVFQGELAR